MKYLLDTSTLVALLHGDTSVHETLISHDRAEVLVPDAALAQLEYALAVAPRTSARDRLKRRLRVFAEEFKTGAWSTETNRAYGRIRAELESRGLTPTDFDVSIAALAVSLGACLVTCSPEGLAGIRGLRLENWSVA